MAKYDVLIVGQGLAGTVLAHHLIQAKNKIFVIDPNHKSAASNIAAGIINPVTGRRYVKSWLIDLLIPQAKKTYAELESLLKVKLLYNAPILRSLHSIENENDWMMRLQDDAYTPYLEIPFQLEGHKYKHIKASKSYGKINGSYQLNIPLLIKKFREHLSLSNLILNEAFVHEDLVINDDILSYHGHEFKQVIFCEGQGIRDNPYFNYVPTSPNKGEALYLDIPNLNIEFLIRDKIFLVPQRDLYWSGGGYLNYFEDQEPSEKFKKEYSDTITKMIDCPFQVVDHKAGIRLASKDRKPLIGIHPRYQNLLLFNGFGTKGASLVPYFSNQLVNRLSSALDVQEEVNIKRYLKFYTTENKDGNIS